MKKTMGNSACLKVLLVPAARLWNHMGEQKRGTMLTGVVALLDGSAIKCSHKAENLSWESSCLRYLLSTRWTWRSFW